MSKRNIGVQLYLKLDSDLNTLHWRYFRAYSAFCVFDTLKYLKSPPHAGKNKVHTNVKTLVAFNEFFRLSEDALNVYFILETAKLFDLDKRSLSIPNLIEKIEKNLPHLNFENYKTFRLDQNGELSDHFFENFKPINKKDIQAAKRSLKRIEKLIKKVIDHRNESLAHDDLKKKHVPITRVEFVRLFKTTEKVLNLISTRLLFSSHLYDRVKPDTSRSTRSMLDALTLGQKEKLKRVTKSYQKKWGNLKKR